MNNKCYHGSRTATKATNLNKSDKRMEGDHKYVCLEWTHVYCTAPLIGICFYLEQTGRLFYQFKSEIPFMYDDVMSWRLSSGPESS